MTLNRGNTSKWAPLKKKCVMSLFFPSSFTVSCSCPYSCEAQYKGMACLLMCVLQAPNRTNLSRSTFRIVHLNNVHYRSVSLIWIGRFPHTDYYNKIIISAHYCQIIHVKYTLGSDMRALFFAVFLKISHMFSVHMSFVVWGKRGIFQAEEPARLLHTSGASSEGKPWAMENAISLSRCPGGWMVGAEEGKNGAERQQRGQRQWKGLKPHYESSGEMSAWPWSLRCGWLASYLWGLACFSLFIPCFLSASHFPHRSSEKDKFLEFIIKLFERTATLIVNTSNCCRVKWEGAPITSLLSR